MGENRRWEYQGNIDITRGVSAVFGFENERSRFRSRSPSGSLATPLPDFTIGKADVTSLYGQLSIEPLDGLTINGGLRQDDHDRLRADAVRGGRGPAGNDRGRPARGLRPQVQGGDDAADVL